jgi:hypothetical protein
LSVFSAWLWLFEGLWAGPRSDRALHSCSATCTPVGVPASCDARRFPSNQRQKTKPMKVRVWPRLAYLEAVPLDALVPQQQRKQPGMKVSTRPTTAAAIAASRRRRRRRSSSSSSSSLLQFCNASLSIQRWLTVLIGVSACCCSCTCSCCTTGYCLLLCVTVTAVVTAAVTIAAASWCRCCQSLAPFGLWTYCRRLCCCWAGVLQCCQECRCICWRQAHTAGLHSSSTSTCPVEPVLPVQASQLAVCWAADLREAQHSTAQHGMSGHGMEHQVLAAALLFSLHMHTAHGCCRRNNRRSVLFSARGWSG